MRMLPRRRLDRLISPILTLQPRGVETVSKEQVTLVCHVSRIAICATSGRSHCRLAFHRRKTLCKQTYLTLDTSTDKQPKLKPDVRVCGRRWLQQLSTDAASAVAALDLPCLRRISPWSANLTSTSCGIDLAIIVSGILSDQLRRYTHVVRL
ncbi:hypothetical protein BD289DRAFT_443315 [Coniella lustricola]|uniref:Uncharacterized protein n=1 Tax=Coniella lustricola TaxID=2025994 RepID=A0A2T2ZX51_9PEZI|nr:hypothetical protein BD289DRAFT_443315 [Coniella lustricola]